MIMSLYIPIDVYSIIFYHLIYYDNNNNDNHNNDNNDVYIYIYNNDVHKMSICIIMIYNNMLQVLAIHIYRNLMMNQSFICFSLFLFPRVTLTQES